MADKIEEPDYEALQKQWEEEVKINPKTQVFLEQYQQFDWKHLYKQYAFNKMLAYKNAAMYRDKNERQKTQWIDAAEEHLRVIQQKKLFDAQCKWRAGQEIYDEVEICFDFTVWEKDVMTCLFIEEPSTYDVELYCEYLTHSNNVELQLNGPYQWQDYEEFKEVYVTDVDNGNLPAWYEFHNSRTGNGILLTFPDIKGKLEQMYMKLAIEDKKKNAPPAAPYIPHPDANKPYLHYYDKQIHLELARQIETKEMVNIFKEYVEATAHRSTWEHENAAENFHYLSEIKDELVPIESHQDYRIALNRAVKEYRSKKIAEHLPLALEQYQRKRKLKEMGIDSFEDKDNDDFYQRLRKRNADNILLGRKLSGEPLDFNF